jgi:hypothetical protein
LGQRLEERAIPCIQPFPLNPQRTEQRCELP